MNMKEAILEMQLTFLLRSSYLKIIMKTNWVKNLQNLKTLMKKETY